MTDWRDTKCEEELEDSSVKALFRALLLFAGEGAGKM